MSTNSVHIYIYIYVIYVAQRLGILQRAGSFGTGLDCLLLSTKIGKSGPPRIFKTIFIYCLNAFSLPSVASSYNTSSLKERIHVKKKKIEIMERYVLSVGVAIK